MNPFNALNCLASEGTITQERKENLIPLLQNLNGLAEKDLLALFLANLLSGAGGDVGSSAWAGLADKVTAPLITDNTGLAAALAAAIQRANHTGTQSADTLTDGTTNKAFLATERTKLSGIATGATANSPDATLLNRANHTGTQPLSTISQSAATTGQAPIWSGSAWVPGAVSDLSAGPVRSTGSTSSIQNSSITDVMLASAPSVGSSASPGAINSLVKRNGSSGISASTISLINNGGVGSIIPTPYISADYPCVLPLTQQYRKTLALVENSDGVIDRLGSGGIYNPATGAAVPATPATIGGAITVEAGTTWTYANSTDTANHRAAINAAAKREYKTANFTAVAYGRYHTTNAGTLVVTTPATGAVGDIFDVVIATGSATVNGVTYSASRFPIEVICTVAGTPGTWVTPTARVSSGMGIRSSGAEFDLQLSTSEVLTADRALSWNVGNAARTVTLTGNPTMGDWFDQSVKTTASPTFGALTVSSGSTANVLTVGNQVNNSTSSTLTFNSKSAGGTNLSASWVMRPNANFALDCYGGTDAIKVDASNGRVAFTRGMEGDSYYNGKLAIGSTLLTSENDGLLVVNKGYSTATGNHHAIRVVSTDSVLAAGAGVNFFDAQAIVSSSNNIDHIAEFQARSTKSGTGTMNDWFGFFTAPILSGGSTTRAAHINIEDVTGAGTLTTQYGLRIKALTKGTTNNYGVVVEGNNPSVFGGTVRLKVYTVATLPASPTAGDTACVNDALAPAFLATVVGGGSIFTQVVYNGTNWQAQ